MVISRANLERQLQSYLVAMSSMTQPTWDLLPEDGFVYGCSAAAHSLNGIVGQIARTDIPVLVMGESGTGKDAYIRLIQKLAGLQIEKVKKLSCTTLQPGQLLGDLRAWIQGHCDGQEDSHCALFLDGVDDLDADCQRVLLSLLPDGEGTLAKPGGSVPIRLLSTSSRNLDKEIEAGRFRRELYFRINGVCLRLPPLRERKEDIPGFVEFFLAKHALELNRKAPKLDVSDLELLQAYDWPGNIRELANLTRKIVALGESKVALIDLQTRPTRSNVETMGGRGFSLKMAAKAASRRTEREMILKALERTHWNRKRAARELQISYKSLLYKIKEIGVQGDNSKGLQGEKT